MELQIDIRNATRTSIRATVRKDPTLKMSIQSLRTLILNMAAHAMGKDTKQLLEPANPAGLRGQGGMGYDLRDGWQKTVEDVDGFQVVTYTVTPLTGYQRAQRLHDEGGTTPAAGGGFNFWLPGEYPAPRVTVLKVKQQGQ
jgi:hypothetical protein